MRLDTQHIHCLLIAGVNNCFRERSWLLDALMINQVYTNEIVVEGTQAKVGSQLQIESMKYPNLKVGAIVRINSKHIGIVETIVNDQITLTILSDGTSPCFRLMDVFDVPSATVQEVFGNHPFTTEKFGDTTVGRFILNIMVLQYPFSYQVFPYVNGVWKPSKIVSMVKDQLLEKHITVAEFEKFWNYLYFIGHMTELSTPSLTVKSLQTNPKIPEIKKKFLEEHKGQMHDPLVIQKYERQLIEADKEYLGDDPSVTMFNGLGDKSYEVQRKKMFLSVGGVPGFGDPNGGMDFIPNSLMEGWTKEAIPSIANEIRDGSYSRGVETAKGGAETKLVMRVFQDTIISEEDCGTKRTIPFDCSQFDGRQFIGRTIRVGDTDVIVTSENLDKYVTGKVIHLYSPLTCETKNNFCYKCCGHRAKELHDELIGIQTVKITNGFMYKAMKSMHGTSLKVRHNKLSDIML